MVFNKLQERARVLFNDNALADSYALKAYIGMRQTFSLPSQEVNIKKAYVQSIWSGDDVFYGHASIDFGADSTGVTISDNLINTSLISKFGTVEHSTVQHSDKYKSLYNDGEEPIMLTDARVIDDKLDIKFELNTSSPDYETTKEAIKNNELNYISPEFINGINYNNHILHADEIRLSLTGSPKQKNNIIKYN